MNPASLLGSSSSLNAATLNPVQGLAADATSLNNLKLKAGQDAKGAIKEAAKQFESLFMREIIKSMREATTKSGLMEDSAGENMATDMLDQQMAVQMTGLPGGLSEAIERQLARQMDPSSNGAAAKGVSAYQRAARNEAQAAATAGAPGRITESQTAFVSKLGTAASRVAAEAGIPAQLHDWPGRARNRLGPKRNSRCRRGQLLQPVWHQGHGWLDGQGGRDHHHRIHQRRGPQRSRPSSAPTTRTKSPSATTPA
jgi:Rod binding domain-containing protein